MPKQPFEVSFAAIQKDPEPFVTSVFSSLASEFLLLPKGMGFVEYPTFETGYEALKRATAGFEHISADRIFPVVLQTPIAVIVLRTMLGFTPPEWAYIATQKSSLKVSQSSARTLDRNIRLRPTDPIKGTGLIAERLRCLVETACALLNDGAPPTANDRLHRLDKADTKDGAESIRRFGGMGVPYAMLLYERFLGRPFAGHRDSVSEIVGDVLESAIEEVLSGAAISFRKTKRAERLPGFDQAPDFVIPSEFNPKVVIEAKVTEDDGTARDKVTRIQHLDRISREGQHRGRRKFEVIACIAGRGFGERREDMKKMLIATRGKVFTSKTLGSMVEFTDLRKFRAKQ